jgi:choline-sulfatase
MWGKSTFYEESVAVPMIAAGPGFAPGLCDTPVSLLDLSVTIPAQFGAEFAGAEGTRPLTEIASSAPEPERPIFSEYHAAGAVSGGFMLRKGRWKLNYYMGFAPELFDLEDDPEELRNLAASSDHAETLAEMIAALHGICDPAAVDAQAFADQDALIASYGGRAAAFAMGAPGATPPPKVSP